MVIISPEMYSPVQSNPTQLIPVTNQQTQQQHRPPQTQLPTLSVSQLNSTTPVTSPHAHNNTNNTGELQKEAAHKNVNSETSKSTPKEKEVTEKVETLNISDKSGDEFSISYIVKKLATSSNKYREKGSSTIYCCQLCPYTTKFSTHLREHLPHHRQYPRSVALLSYVSVQISIVF